MKNSKTIQDGLVRCANEFISGITRNIGVGVVIACSTFCGTMAGLAVGGKGATAAEKNLVMIPEYSTEDLKDAASAGADTVETEDTAQYIPVTEERPLLHKLSTKSEIVNGAKYNDGAETAVDPNPGFDTQDEPILESIVRVENSTNGAQPSPGPFREPGVPQRGAGLDTAEVR